MTFHYTYRITNIIKSIHYYGVRTSKVLPKEDLGYIYFSSSSNKEFIKDQKDNPQSYKYKVIKTSNTREQAVELEIVLHNKFNVGINEHFYNKVKQTSTGFDTSGTKQNRTKEHSQKLKDNNYNRLIGPSKETILKNKIAHQGIPTGRTISKENQYKMHNAQKKTFKVYNSDDILVFETKGNFELLCKENNLPFGALKKSYQSEGKPIYRRTEDKTRAIKNGYKECIGFYAIKS